MSPGRRPPILARLLLRLTTPREDHEFVAGDLEEDWAARTGPGGSRFRAGLWYWGQVLSTALAYGSGGFPPFDELGQDLRYGLRTLARRPGFSLLAATTLAVGIGATTSVFSVADRVLFRPPPGVEEPDRLVQVRFRAPHLEDEETGISYPNFLDFAAAGMPAVDALVAWQTTTFQVAASGGATALVPGAAVLGDYFGALGVRARRGRLFRGAETPLGEAEPVAVLSSRGAATLFGEGAGAVGRTLEVNGISVSVVGVAEDGFRGVTRGGDADLWIPYGLYGRVRHMGDAFYSNRQSGALHDVVARLAPGADGPAAEAQLRAVMERLVDAHPEPNARYADYRPTVYDALGLSPWAVDRTRSTFTLLFAAVGLVLLIACANVANLLIFRGVRREGESAVRQALGASRSRLLRQQLTESGLLAAGGVVLGVGLAGAAARLLSGLRLPGLPPLHDLAVDHRVLAFAVLTGVLTVLLAGVVPAVIVPRIDLVRSLREASRTATGRSRGARSWLTVAQLGLSLGLLVGALLLARTVRNLQGAPMGFDPARVVEAHVTPDPQGYDEEAGNRFQRELLVEAANLPGVRAAAGAAAGPLRAHYHVDLRRGDDASEEWPVDAYQDAVSPDYFATLGVPLLDGRTFSPEEMDAGWARDSDVAVVNRTLARRLFGAEGAVGETVVQRGYRENTALRVVGVVEDSRVSGLEGPMEPALYRPLGEHWSNGITLLVRFEGPADEATALLRQAVDRVDRRLPFYWVGPVSAKIAELTAEQRFLFGLMGTLALLAALLAGVGLYGVVAYSVAERTREIGIRMAMGARSAEVGSLVLRQSVGLAAGGLLLGGATGWLLTRLVESRLYRVEALDPASWGAAGAAFALLVLVASLAPVLSAVRVDPVRALRTE